MPLLRHEALHRVCGDSFDGLVAEKEEGDGNVSNDRFDIKGSKEL